MKICFVGHRFHLKSRSHLFFLDILKSLGDVKELYSSPDELDGPTDEELTQEIVSGGFDCHVFWQTESIASKCLPWFPKNVILVPMLDASLGRPNLFWQQFHTHIFICFSRALHEKFQMLGLSSYYFQFFPEPVRSTPKPVLTTARTAYFWERRPRETINTALVRKQCRALRIPVLHVHAASDFIRDRALQKARLEMQQGGELEVTYSRWADDPSVVDEHAGTKTFYFAPRQYEGIGMAFLEAMARGQIIVGPDAPTLNEYLGYMSSGILYDMESPFDLPTISERDISRMRSATLARCRSGHEEWLQDVERLKSIIVRDGRRWIGRDYSSHFGGAIRRAANARMRKLSDGGSDTGFISGTSGPKQ